LNNTPQHIHYDVNFPENFNAQGPAKLSGEGQDFVNNWPCFDVTTTLQKQLFKYFTKGSSSKCQNCSRSGHSHKIMQM